MVAAKGLGKCLLVALATAVLAVMVTHIRWDPGHFDEAVRLYGGERVLQGEMPARDFYCTYVVGQLYLPALAFRIGGTGVLCYRVMLFLLALAKLLALWLVARKISDGWTATVTTIVVGSLIWYMPQNYNEPALTLLLLAVLLAWRWAALGRWQWLCGAAVVHALAGFFRWDWWLLSMVGCLAWTWLLAGRGAQRRGLGHRLFSAGTFLVLSSVVFAAGIALTYGPHVWELYADSVERAVVATRASALPFPKPPPPNPLVLLRGEITFAQWWEILWIRVMFYAPGLLIAAGGLMAYRRLREGADRRLDGARMALLVLVAPWFYVYAAGRSDPSKASILVQLTMPLAAGMWHGLSFVAGRRLRVVGRATVILLWSVLASWPICLEPSRQQIPRRPYELARARGMVGPSQQVRNYEDAVRCVQRLTRRPIFVGLERHDALLRSDILFYFLSERPSATRWHQFNPGVTDTRDVQDQIVADIEKHDVEAVVRWQAACWPEPNQSQYGTGERTLDRHLERNYRFYTAFGDHEIWRRVGSRGQPRSREP